MDWVARKFTVCNYNTVSGVKPAGSSNASRASILCLELALWANLKGRTARYKSTTKPFRRLSWIALLFCVSVLLVPLQSQAQSITYSGGGFTETPANDGSVTGSIKATLSGDNYLTPLDINTDVTLGNIPAGIMPSISVVPSATNWAAQSAAEASSWNSVTYGDGLFVAVAGNGTNRVMTSPDGVNWTARAATDANSWTSVTYGNGKFVAVASVGTRLAMTSPDGITWTPVRSAAVEGHFWNSVAYGNGLFVAVAGNGTNRVITSPDGITWTSRAASEANVWQTVTYGNGLFVAVAINGTNRVMTSPDGITWTSRVAAEANFWQSVTYGDGLFVAVGGNGTNRVMTSPDGITWAPRAAAEANFWSSVTYGNGQFVALARNGTNRVMTSADGIIWTPKVATEANSWNGVALGKGQFVAVASSGTNRVMRASADAVATLTLSGNASTHIDANDVSDLTYDFADSAFSASLAASVSNATGPASSNIGVDFNAPPNITYGGGFIETSANDGSVTGSLTATLSGDSYLPSLDITTDVTLGNIPDGLIPSIGVVHGTASWETQLAAETNDWKSVAYGNGLFVAVSALGTNNVMTSPDGINWTARTAAEQNFWTSVTYGNGQFVAVGVLGSNRVMTSPDGIIWTARIAAEENFWTSVTYGNGQFVAVAITGTNRVMTSPDGITWIARAAAEDNPWRAVTYGNGLFVAVASSGANRVMTSPDGITWTAQTAAEPNIWFSVTYGNGQFVAVAKFGTNLVMTSPNGINWTARAAAEPSTWNSVTYGNSQFVAVANDGMNRVMTSIDGISWTAIAAAESNEWASVIYGNDLFVAVAESGVNRVMSASADVVAILTLSGNADVHVDANDVADITFGFTDSAFKSVLATNIVNAIGPVSSNLGIDFNNPPTIIFGGSGFDESAADDGSVSGSITATLSGDSYVSQRLVDADVGYLFPLLEDPDVVLGNIPPGLIPSLSVVPETANWSAQSAAEANQWQSVAYGNGLFVAVAISGANRVMTSPDGVTWTPRAAAEDNFWTSVSYGNGLFVAVAQNGVNRVMTSPDGIIWTPRVAAEASEWVSVTYGNGQFMAIAQLGVNRVMTSPDGITWTSRTGAQANFWSSVTYGNGLFVAVASSGANRVMTSPNGIIWSPQAAAEGNSWNSVTYGNGQFVAVAPNGTNRVMTSPDGITWTARTAAEGNAWNSVGYGNGQFVAVAQTGVNRVMTSEDGITWGSRAAAEVSEWISVSYGNGQFVAVAFLGGNRVMTASADTVVTLTLSGNADVHIDANDISDITFDFTDIVFSAVLANNIVNAGGPASSNLGVDFDDPNLVSLSASALIGAEDDGTVITLTGTSARPVGGDQTLSLVTVGTAIDGVDYILSNRTITIPDGGTSGSETFTVLSDAIIEGNESATMLVIVVSRGIGFESFLSQTIKIVDKPDLDDDTVINSLDNCPYRANADQADLDSDGTGDVCDSDADNDQVTSATDINDLDPLVCLDTDLDTCDDCSSSTFAPNDDGLDTDGDGMCDAGDLDDDNDEILDDIDNCPLVENQDQNPSLCEDEMCFPIKTKNRGVAVICL